jgi:hypothetical protein
LLSFGSAMRVTAVQRFRLFAAGNELPVSATLRSFSGQVFLDIDDRSQGTADVVRAGAVRHD